MMIFRWYSGGWLNSFIPRSSDVMVVSVETMMFRLTTRARVTQAAEEGAVVSNAQKQQADYAQV
jgi:hypothetical protein